MRTEDIETLIEPAIEALGCQLWGLQLVQSKRPVLRIFIDTPTGAGIEDCEKVSRQVSQILDVEDPFRGEYTLEVSSPGMDRLLFKAAHYARYVGEQVSLRLRLPFEGQRNFKGVLRGVENDEVVLFADDEELLFPIESIEKAQLLPQFNDAQPKRSLKKKHE